MKKVLYMYGMPIESNGKLVPVETFSLMAPCEISADEYIEAIDNQFGKETIDWLDVIIISDSASDVARDIANKIFVRNGHTAVVRSEDFRKRTVDDVYAEIMDDDFIEGNLVPDESFKLGTDSKEFYGVIEKIREELKVCREKNKEYNNGNPLDPFRIEFIPEKYRKGIGWSESISLTDDVVNDYHVLVLDESMDFVKNFVLDSNPDTVAIFKTEFSDD